MMNDNPTTIVDALPRNVIELAKEADRAFKTGKPDYFPAVVCQFGLPRSPTPGQVFERTSGNVSLQVEGGKAWDGAGLRNYTTAKGRTPARTSTKLNGKNPRNFE